ncbi:MAG TPA: DegT/DnrJ/EryC1/StrS family aminotransferase [Flavobacteriaceae bacterium]|nr:DegT/DnrJ/EryC1/StrS family aminotransferase [Flavobacteriaceae bacterium]
MPGFEVFGEEERKEVNDVLETGVLMRYGFDAIRNGHFKAKEFELKFADLMQVKYAQLTSSGTSALTVALASAGVGAGDEVIIPTFTFVASFESIIALGAVPILCDVDDTLCLDPEAVKKAITPKTKVVMPVHMCGSMADLKPLQTICNEHNLLLLEDACQAIGAEYDGKMVGAIGDLGCFSFDFVKTITCGEGGAVITNNSVFAENADKFQDHGHDHLGNDRGAEKHPFLGYNYRISELNAAVGLGQLKKFDPILEKQRANFKILRDTLGSIPEVDFRRVPESGIESGAFLNFFLPDEKTTKKAHMAISEAGVDACFYWYDNNWHYYKKWEHLIERKSLGPLSNELYSQLQDFEKADFSQSDLWVGRTISCLIKVGWTASEMQERAEKITNAIKSVL